MTKLERARNKVIRAACAIHDGHDDAMLRTINNAVEELFLIQTELRAKRREALKRYPLIYCRACKRRHRSNVEHVVYGRGKKKRYRR